MTDTPAYTPPEVWIWEKDNSPKWRYSNTNRPIAGATHEMELARAHGQQFLQHNCNLDAVRRPQSARRLIPSCQWSVSYSI